MNRYTLHYITYYMSNEASSILCSEYNMKTGQDLMDR